MVRTKSLNQWPPASLPSHCRIDHGTIGYIHTEWPDEERCPLCRLQSELDAERAAHEETKAAWKAALDAHRDRETETKLECMRKLDAIKARLALAEAVCQSCDEEWDDSNNGVCQWYDERALAAWKAAK